MLPFICTDAIGISSILKEIRHFSFVSKGQGWGLAFGVKYAHNLLNWVDFFLAQKNLLMHLWKPYHQTEQAETKTKLACLRGTFKNLICSTEMLNLSFCLFFFRLASPSHSYYYETFLFFDLKQKELALPGPLLGFLAGISGKETACQ